MDLYHERKLRCSLNIREMQLLRIILKSQYLNHETTTVSTSIQFLRFITDEKHDLVIHSLCRQRSISLFCFRCFPFLIMMVYTVVTKQPCKLELFAKDAFKIEHH